MIGQWSVNTNSIIDRVHDVLPKDSSTNHLFNDCTLCRKDFSLKLHQNCADFLFNLQEVLDYIHDKPNTFLLLTKWILTTLFIILFCRYKIIEYSCSNFGSHANTGTNDWRRHTYPYESSLWRVSLDIILIKRSNCYILPFVLIFCNVSKKE